MEPAGLPQNVSASKPTLSSQQCSFSATQLEKIYCAQCLTMRTLNTASMAQAYRAEKLQELQEALQSRRNVTEPLDEVCRTADFILWLSGTASIALGKSMAEAVVAQRHLWLTLAELPESQRSVFLQQAVEPQDCLEKQKSRTAVIREGSRRRHCV